MKYILIIASILFSVIRINSQINPSDSNPFFWEDTIPRIDIIIDPNDLATLLEDISSYTEYKATFVYNNFRGINDTIENVGFRIRGNISRMNDQKSFKVSMNTFEPGRKYYGLEKIDLKAPYDPSFVRQKLAWHMCREYGINSIDLNHILLYVNNELYGLYTNVEHIDEEYVERIYGNHAGNLYKCRHPANLDYISDNQEDYKFENLYTGDRLIRSYELKTNTYKDDYTDLMNLTKALQIDDDQLFKETISKILNIRSLLKFFAMEVYMGHWDSYSINANNYYLYHNSESDKFEYITYDLDITLGGEIGFSVADGDIYNYKRDGESRPLRTRILEIPEYRNNYTFYLKQLTELLPPDSLRPIAEQIQEYIAPYVSLDHYYMYSMAEFYSALDSPLGFFTYGAMDFLTQRYNNILGQLDGSNTSPIISNVEFNKYQSVDSDSIIIQCMIEDDDANPVVKLFSKFNSGDYEEIQMDFMSSGSKLGVTYYEASLPPSEIPGQLFFYIKAEDSNEQTTRYPYTGEYVITIFPKESNLKINEILTSNTKCMTDEYGESDDWIEIYNAGTDSVSLVNKYLSDSYANSDEWKMPDTVLQAGDLIRFWADDDEWQGENHTGFRLSRSGETIYMFENIDGNYRLLDSLKYSDQEKNISYGLLPDGSYNVRILEQLTPEFENDTRGLVYAFFQVDMTQEITKREQTSPEIKVDVVGDFNNWLGSDLFYDMDNDSIYQQTVYGLSEGQSIQYRFRIDEDNNLIEFPENPGSAGHRIYILNEGCNSLEHIFNDGKMNIIETISTNDMILYPNPATHILNVNVDKAGTLEIYTMQGQLMIKSQLLKNGNLIPVSHLPSGSYTVKIITDSEVHSEIVIIQ